MWVMALTDTQRAKAADAALKILDAQGWAGLPLDSGRLAALFAQYPDGIVTIEDGLIGDPETGIRGFASLVRGAAYGRQLPLIHLGITDPRIAPSEHFVKVWEHFGITEDAVLTAVLAT